jgi:hypothetical protein
VFYFIPSIITAHFLALSSSIYWALVIDHVSSILTLSESQTMLQKASTITGRSLLDRITSRTDSAFVAVRLISAAHDAACHSVCRSVKIQPYSSNIPASWGTGAWFGRVCSYPSHPIMLGGWSVPMLMPEGMSFAQIWNWSPYWDYPAWKERKSFGMGDTRCDLLGCGLSALHKRCMHSEKIRAQIPKSASLIPTIGRFANLANV